MLILDFFYIQMWNVIQMYLMIYCLVCFILSTYRFKRLNEPDKNLTYSFLLLKGFKIKVFLEKPRAQLFILVIATNTASKKLRNGLDLSLIPMFSALVYLD